MPQALLIDHLRKEGLPWGSGLIYGGLERQVRSDVRIYPVYALEEMLKEVAEINEGAVSLVNKMLNGCGFSPAVIVYSLEGLFKLAPAKTEAGKSKMNEEFSKYKSLIKLMEATPKVNVSDGFTERIMRRLSETKPALGQLLKLAMLGSGEITASGFRREYSAENQPCFYFLMAGFFFFIIGTILLSSLFYSPTIMVSLLAQVILILMAAFSLVAAGLVMAARVPDASHWAKRALMVYGILIIANAFLIQANSKMALGEVFALTFGATGILMGMVLMRALKSKTNETTAR